MMQHQEDELLQQDEEFAVIMEKSFALQTISKDFIKTGICNYYKAVGEIIFRTDQNFAFQVRKYSNFINSLGFGELESYVPET